LFRRLQIADPRHIQLREWSRLAEELQQGKGAAQQSLVQSTLAVLIPSSGLSDDLAAGWLLDLWTMAPTPAKAMHLRKTSVAQLFKRNRIRRIDAETVLRASREPAINVADGVAEAAIHIGSLVTRLRVVGRELHDAMRP
jgi:hypothetical protein